MSAPLAFPVGIAVGPSGDVYHSGDLHPDFSGMTLRDWFAGQALAAMAERFTHKDDAARNAYRLADAMLTAREAGK